MATAHLIYGHIGSGETPVAKRLEAGLPVVRFTSDEWVAAAYSDDEADIVDFDAALRAVEGLMEPIWRRCLELGVDVVLDMGFSARAKRDHARAAAREAGAGTVLYDVRCDPQTASARVARRNDDLGGAVRMARQTFDDLQTKIEPLGGDEDHTVVEG